LGLGFVQVDAAVIADLCQVIPNITSNETYIALHGYMLMGAFCLMQQFSEVFEIDPLRLVPTTFTRWAGSVTGVCVTLTIFAFLDRQVGFTIAI
jgi:hypothetical protein